MLSSHTAYNSAEAVCFQASAANQYAVNFALHKIGSILSVTLPPYKIRTCAQLPPKRFFYFAADKHGNFLCICRRCSIAAANGPQSS